ncbi:unnamed protein product [Periconia digitata]|uniref:Uncharacterized protein n=1 Tax=Periconia digitata TaxID=1303443 RepID=A0A9W4UKK2_9PLEO|nr:unnamed protein product [Periconia digitata]
MKQPWDLDKKTCSIITAKLIAICTFWTLNITKTASSVDGQGDAPSQCDQSTVLRVGAYRVLARAVTYSLYRNNNIEDGLGSSVTHDYGTTHHSRTVYRDSKASHQACAQLGDLKNRKKIQHNLASLQRSPLKKKFKSYTMITGTENKEEEMTPDTTPDKIYDFILVGAGSSSCLLASRLSTNLPTHTILVLEAGQHIQNDPKVQTPGLSSTLQSDPTYDWQYVSEPEPGLNGRTVKHPRGKLVGGTSAINSHSIVFPNEEWQDRIATHLLGDGDGVEEWSAEGMRGCYARWERRGGESCTEDDDGVEDRVRTSYPRELDFLQEQWGKVFEELGCEATRSGFAESVVGAVTVSNAVDAEKGERSHAGTAFLEPALQRGNVTLKTGVKVDRIVFDEDVDTNGKLHATGVRYTLDDKHHILRGREIILCAGVFESPAILERSGIGSKKILEAANIPILYDLAGVGENLQDHLNCSLSHETLDSIQTRDSILIDPSSKAAALSQYQQTRRGVLAEGPAYSFAFTPFHHLSPSPSTPSPSSLLAETSPAFTNPTLAAQLPVLTPPLTSPTEATATSFLLRCQRNRDLDSLPPHTSPFVPGSYITIAAMLAHPFSRGSSHISTASPHHPPTINFNYLSHPLDTHLLASHILQIDRLFRTPALSSILKPGGRRLPRSWPYTVDTLDDAKGILGVNAASNYHPCGTCAMMREGDGGVVDHRLVVYGTRNVRVCDGSVLPVLPRGNVLCAVYAWAEKGAEILVREGRGGRGV